MSARTIPAGQLRDYAEPIEANLAVLIGAVNVAESEIVDKTPECERAFSTMRQQIAEVFESCGIMRAISLGLYDAIEEKPKKTKPREAAAE